MKDITLLKVKYVYNGKDITVSIKSKDIMTDSLILEKIKEIGKMLVIKIDGE